jgi:hypothetical protein
MTEEYPSIHDDEDNETAIDEAEKTLVSEELPDELIITYSGEAPEFSVRADDRGSWTIITFVNFDGSRGRISNYSQGVTYAVNLPPGVTVRRKDGYPVRDNTTPKDRATLEPSLSAEPIIVGNPFTALLPDALPYGLKYVEQAVPSVYGDLIMGESGGRPIERWHTIDNKVTILVNAHTKIVVEIQAET